MARAPETAFYFEPITERLALVVEGAPFPSDDHWAYLGDPIDMSPDEARITVAYRWPGIDPDDLHVEFDLDFQRAAEELERKRLEEAQGVVHTPSSFDFDVDKLLEQAEALRHAAQQAQLHELTPAALEKAAEDAALQRAADAISNAARRAAEEAASPDYLDSAREPETRD